MPKIDDLNTSSEDDELDIAIAKAEAEYTSDNQLIDAREALSQLKSTHFSKNVEAIRTLQAEMAGEFEKAGINSEEDIQTLAREVRAEIEGIDIGK